MLGQKGFEILGKVGAARQKFEIVFLLWVGHGAAAEEGRADVGADAGLAADKPGVDLQTVPAPGCQIRTPRRWGGFFR